MKIRKEAMCPLRPFVLFSEIKIGEMFESMDSLWIKFTDNSGRGANFAFSNAIRFAGSIAGKFNDEAKVVPVHNVTITYSEKGV